MAEPWTIPVCTVCGGQMEEYDGVYHHRYGTDPQAGCWSEYGGTVAPVTWMPLDDERVRVIPVEEKK